MPKAVVDHIVRLLNQNDFFSLKERYDDYAVTDMPYRSIRVTTLCGRSKKVLIYGGHISDEINTKKFYELYNEIIKLSGIEQWLSSTFEDKKSDYIV